MSNKLLDYQLFPEEYFSGCDVSIYFGDTWVDEIVSLNFAMVEQLQPIYGYNSLVYDDMAKGTRIVQGSFRLNFKESGYLRNVLKKYTQTQNSSRAYMSHPQNRVPAQETFESLPDNTVDISGYLKFFPEKDWPMIAEKFQRAAWGSRAEIGTESSLERYNFFNVNNKGFNIIITYGIPNGQGGPSSANLTRGTFHKIVGVHISTVNQVVNPDGSPVFEDYEFIAKDLN